MIQGSARLVERARRTMVYYSIGAECLNMFVGRDNIRSCLARAAHTDPDVFSLDIDGIDYYIADAVMRAGFRPKVFVVEYNSVFGPDRLARSSIETARLHGRPPNPPVLRRSVAGWRRFFERHGYRF